MHEALNTAIEAALLAGAAIMEEYGKPHEIEYKKDESPVTQADRIANDLIVAYLNVRYPDYAMLAEESIDEPSRLDNDWCWIVDPIDGTKEYIKRNGEFTVNIALSHCHEIQLGVIYVPVTGELYYASQGHGATYRLGDKETRIHVSDRVEDLVVLIGRSEQPAISHRVISLNDYRIKQVIRTGSSLKGCLIARGKADVYYRFGPTMEWDLAAMEIIIREAGGIILEMDGKPFRYNREDPLNAKGFYVLNSLQNKLD